MATYNRAHLIEETLDSILNQSFKNWECIIIDDGSTDNTKEILQPYLEKDSRLNYYERSKNHKKGLPGCRNQGLELAKGDYIIFFDDDDIVHPENLKICLGLLRDKNSSFCRYDKKPFWGDLKMNEFKKINNHVANPFHIRDLDKMITGEIPFASCCVLWDKKCFEQERFNEELMYAEEWECYSRILSRGYKGFTTDAVLYFNRKHPNSNTGEFQRKNFVRINSQIKAAIQILENFSSKGLFNKKLKVFFVRMGFDLNSLEIIKKSLDAAGSNTSEKWKYHLGFKFYPILKPYFYLKGKILKN